MVGFSQGDLSATGVTVSTAGGFKTSTSAGNTALFQAYDVDGATYVTFATLTANNTPTFDLSSSTTIGGNPITTGGITEIDTASGNALPSSGVVSFDASNCGSSVSFSGSGSTISFSVSDASNNTIIGSSSGNATAFGTNNVALGTGVLFNATSVTQNVGIGNSSLIDNQTGDNNTAIGSSSLIDLVSGSDNIALGTSSGSAYTSSESSNITIGSPGVLGDNNTIRIGSPGSGAAEQNLCYIAGISAATPAVNGLVMLVDSSTQQVTPVSGQGTATQVLTSNGAGVAPTWQAAAGGFSWTQATITTSDGVATALATIGTSSNSVITIEGIITAAKSDYSDACGGRFVSVFKNNSGTLVQVGSSAADVETSTTATFTLTASGTDIIILVAGIAATTYNWKASYRTITN